MEMSIMPYKNTKEVKKSVKGVEEYSDHGLEAFRKAFNSCEENLEAGEDESKCYAIGHHAAKQAMANEQVNHMKEKFEK